MECDIATTVLPGEEDPVSDGEREFYVVGDSEKNDLPQDGSEEFANIPLSNEEGLTEALPPSEPKKRFTLSRGISLKNVVNTMKRKPKTGEGEPAEECDTDAPEPQKGYLRQVLNRVTNGTFRMWSSIGKTFTNSSKDDMDAGTSKPSEMADDEELPSAEARSQTLGRRLQATLKLMKPTKN